MDGKLQVDWLSLEPAPNALMDRWSLLNAAAKQAVAEAAAPAKHSLTDVCGCSAADSCQNRASDLGN